MNLHKQFLPKSAQFHHQVARLIRIQLCISF